MNTPPTTGSDKLQALFDLLPQEAASRGFEQETMRRVHLAAQRQRRIRERWWAVKSAMVAAASAACITAALVGGLVRLNAQHQSIALLVQRAIAALLSAAIDGDYLWWTAAGVALWLASRAAGEATRG